MVVYAGVVGPHAERADRQLGSLLHHDGDIKPARLSDKDQRSLCTHDARSEKVAARLGKDGVVAGQVVKGKRTNRLRVYVYDGDGDLRSQVEVPLVGDALDKGGIATLRGSVVEDAVALGKAHDAAPDEEPVIVVEDDEAEPAKKADDEPPAQAAADDSAADAEQADDGEAEADDSNDEAADDDSAYFADDVGAPLHMGASVGLGVIHRDFLPGGRPVAGYDSDVVGTARFAGDIEPTENTRLDFITERSLGMTTPVMGERAPTSLTRWEAQATWALVTGKLTLAPAFGVGQRGFSITSTAPSRSPDGEYLYLLAGARSQLTLGPRTTLAANVRIEPVIGGAQSTMSSYGSASRWAYDLGLTLDVCVKPWLMLRADAGFQSFSWTFADGGQATDRYFGAVFSLGTRY